MAIFSLFNGAMWFRKMLCALLFLLLVSVAPLWAATYLMPPAGADLIGYRVVVKARGQDTLLDIARQYDLGQDEILLANPNVDRWLPGEGTDVVLPARFIFPRAEREGVVLNLPEMRLYYFYKGLDEEPMVTTNPVSVGRMDWNTPLGKARIERKDKDPSWRPPESLKLEAIAAGDDPLPDVVLPGPDNPLGRYALRLSIPGYLIHSTNKPYGVGMRVTHGCVRMYPEDIEHLFPIISVGTRVQIVNQPIKVGWQDKTLFLEVHPLMDEDREEKNQNLICIAYEMIFNAIEGKDAILDVKTIKQALQEKNGIPVPITHFVGDGFEF